MGQAFGTMISGLMERLVRWVVLPVTSVIPRLVASGALLVLFAGLWAVFLGALVISPAILDDASRWLGQQPLPIQGIAWLLFLPVTAGLAVVGTDWPYVLRLVVVAALAGWNLLVFVPRRNAAQSPASAIGGI